MRSFKEMVTEKNEFYRIPEKIINNDFYVFQKEIAQMYKSLKGGNDLNYNYFKDLKKTFEKIEKSIEHTPKS